MHSAISLYFTIYKLWRSLAYDAQGPPQNGEVLMSPISTLNPRGTGGGGMPQSFRPEVQRF